MMFECEYFCVVIREVVFVIVMICYCDVLELESDVDDVKLFRQRFCLRSFLCELLWRDDDEDVCWVVEDDFVDVDIY